MTYYTNHNATISVILSLLLDCVLPFPIIDDYWWQGNLSPNLMLYSQMLAPFERPLICKILFIVLQQTKEPFTMSVDGFSVDP